MHGRGMHGGPDGCDMHGCAPHGGRGKGAGGPGSGAGAGMAGHMAMMMSHLDLTDAQRAELDRRLALKLVGVKVLMPLTPTMASGRPGSSSAATSSAFNPSPPGWRRDQ